MHEILPPDYLDGKVMAPDTSEPAALLVDGSWCGHGEPVYHVFDIVCDGIKSFMVSLPPAGQEDGELLPVAVRVTPAGSQDGFLVYDSRRHPVCLYFEEPYSSMEPSLVPYACPRCDKDIFKVAVGFEMPGDSEGPNDTSWFSLACEGVKCGAVATPYDDETA